MQVENHGVLAIDFELRSMDFFFWEREVDCEYRRDGVTIPDGMGEAVRPTSKMLFSLVLSKWAATCEEGARGNLLASKVLQKNQNSKSNSES